MLDALHSFNASFRRRLIQMNRATVERTRPTSELLGEALHELSAALKELRLAEAELRRQTQEGRDLRARLEEERDRYRELFLAVPVACLFTDANGAIGEASRAAQALLGVGYADLRGTALASFVAPEHRRTLQALLEQASRRGDGAREEVAAPLILRPRGRTAVRVTATAVQQPPPAYGVRWALAVQGELEVRPVADLPGRRVEEQTPAQERTLQTGVGTEFLLSDFEPVEGRRSSDRLAEHFRERIAGGLYCGLLRGGDPLPSIRAVARQTPLNHKAVSRAYGALKQDGLVRVRNRSGVYVAPLDEPNRAEAVISDEDRWVAGLVEQAGRWGLEVRDLLGLLGRTQVGRQVRCLCVDDVEDDRAAMCEELSRWFELHTVPLAAADDTLAEEVRAAALVVTSPFHARTVREHQPQGQPLVLTTPYPQLRAHRRRSPDQPALVCADPGLARRLLASARPTEPPPMVVACSDPSLGTVLQQHSHVLFTSAARHRLGLGAEPSPPALTYFGPSDIARIARILLALRTTQPLSAPLSLSPPLPT